MSASNFLKKHGPAKLNVQSVIAKWYAEKQARDFLGTPIATGVLLADALIGDGLIDFKKLPEPVYQSILEIFPKRVDSYEEAVTFLTEKYLAGGATFSGTINAIQGRIGEHLFLSSAHGIARLADQPNQAYWDVQVFRENAPTQFVQVKILEDSEQVVKHIQKTEAAIDRGLAKSENGEVIQQIDFAVNADIFDEVQARVYELNLNTQILKIDGSREQIRDLIVNSTEDISYVLDDFFRNLIGTSLTAAAIHGMVNGFLLYKGAKEKDEALEDAIYSSLISAGGVVATLGTRMALTGGTVGLEAVGLETIGAVLGGPIGVSVAIGVGVGARATLKRIGERRFLIKKLIEGNEKLDTYLAAAKL